MNQELLSKVVCLRCRGRLRELGKCVVCVSCKASFVVKEGIPVLME